MHFLSIRQQEILSSQVQTLADGSKVVIPLPKEVDAVVYTDHGVEFQSAGRSVSQLAAKEVLIEPISISLCGTDIDLIDKAHRGELPKSAIGKVVGHEAAGFIVGVGNEVTNWQLGQLVCLDSHFACELPEHTHFNDCIESGQSCDGIVGGIRGAQLPDGTRAEPRDGYWSRLFTAPVSSLPLELPVSVAQHLAAPSTLESLGNMYMVIGQLDSIGLLEQADSTLFVVSGLGATGYPLTAVATHYGFEVVGLDPDPAKREFAQHQGTVAAAYADWSELAPHLANQQHVAVVITAGVEVAQRGGIEWLNQLDNSDLARRVAVIFGLFSDPTKPMPFDPNQTPQRDFVFSRQSFTTEQATEVYGICGRDLPAWQRLMSDLQPAADGSAPKLAAQLNAAQHVLTGQGALEQIATVLNQGSRAVLNLLEETKTTKLAAYLAAPEPPTTDS